MNEIQLFSPQAEIYLESDRSIRVVAAAHPFSARRSEHFFASGTTLQEIVETIQPRPVLRQGAHVFIGDDRVPPNLWARVRPKPGADVTMRCVPMGGGGGKILRMVLMLVVAALSFAFPYLFPAFAALYPLLTAAIQVGITILGSILINTLIPPASPRMKNLTSGSESPTMSIAGSRNSINLYGPVPRIYGKHRMTPPYGAKPYTEIVGRDQWLRMIFDLGYGPLEITELKIGESNLSDFDEVEYEIRQGYPDDEPLTLYKRSVSEESFSIALPHLTGSPPTAYSTVRTTQPNIDEVSIDITFLQGLTQFSEAGTRSARTVEVLAEYAVAGSGVWVQLAGQVSQGGQTTAELKRPNPNSTPLGDVRGGQSAIITPKTKDILISIDPLTAIVKVGRKNTDVPICSVTLSSTLSVAPTMVDQRSAAMIASGYFTPTLHAGPPINVTLAAGTVTIPAWKIVENSTNAVREGRSITLPRGQYDIRMSRVTEDSTDDKILDRVFWTALRSIRDAPPITEGGHCLIAMRIKATDQLNGVVDEFNCIAQSILLDYDGAAWVERPTSNPAAIDIDVLCGTANGWPVTDELLDTEAYQDWAEANVQAGRQFNAVIDFETNVFDMRKMVCAAGRAAPTMRDGRFSIVRDVKQTVPVQHFTPRNSWGFKGTKAFPDQPDAWRIPFINANKSWQADERVVYFDGFNETNADRFETIDMFGITDPDQVWKDGRYLQAVAKLRPESFELNCDFEYLIAGQGDLVLVTHDVLAVGIASGRVKTVQTNGATVVALTVDETLPMVFGRNYGVSVRTVGGRIAGQVATTAGDNLTVTFTTPVAFVAGVSPIAVGDLFGFGELGRETLSCLVKTIEPGRELVARLTLVPASPGVHDAEVGAIPPFDPVLTRLENAPQKPTVVSVDSGDLALLISKDGTVQSRIVITLAPMPGGQAALVYQSQFRPSNSTKFWIPAPDALAAGGVVSILPVEDGQIYDVRLRALSQLDRFSDWVYVLAHKVIGKTAPPPTPTSFYVSQLANGTRRFTWTLNNPPPDVRVGGGFQIRYYLGVTSTWSVMTVLPPGFLVGYALETNQLDAGSYTLAIKTIDSSGNESLAARFITGDFQTALPTGVLMQSLEHERGWPGAKTSCYVSGDGILRAVSSGNWGTLAATWAALPATWDTIVAQVSPITYETEVFDLGGNLTFTPELTTIGNGSISLTMKTGAESDGNVVGTYGAVGHVAAKRYVQFKVSIADGTAPSLSAFTVILAGDILEVDYQDIDTSGSDVGPFHRIATGHFTINASAVVTTITRATITAYQSAGAGWTSELLAKSPNAEFKIYQNGVLADAVVDVNIKGLK